MTNKALAALIAERCSDAYSSDRYRSWEGVAAKLLRRGLDERQVEAVMRSKWTRWAADAWEKRESDYGRVPASAVIAYLDQSETAESIAALTRETFGNDA